MRSSGRKASARPNRPSLALDGPASVRLRGSIGTMERPMQELASLAGNWGYPTSIRFGAGRIRELPDACRELGIGRPLLVTDPGLAALPMVVDAVAACEDAGLGCAMFSDVRGNPVEANVRDGVAALRAGDHDGGHRLRGRQRPRRRKGSRAHGGSSPPHLGLRGSGGLVDPGRRGGHGAGRRGPHHLRHRLGDRTRIPPSRTPVGTTSSASSSTPR